MYFKLDFGRERTFDFIHFYHGISSETPLRWCMAFYDRYGNYIRLPDGRKFIKTGDPETPKNSVAIRVTHNKPIKAKYIWVEINEANEPEVWCIKRIYIRILILHNLFKHTVGNLRLDEL